MFSFLPAMLLAAAFVIAGSRAAGVVRGQNAPPAITAAGALVRQQGAAAQVAQIATVSDAETAAGSLVVTATTTPTGISVTGIANNNGAITASVAAGCAAATGMNTVVLTVTDGGGATATANLTIEVAPAPALTLGSYPVVRIPQGMGATLKTSGTPTGIQTMTAEAAGFTGTFSADPATGAITIANAGPAGEYTVIVTAGGCGGGTVLRTFPVTVTAPASWESAGLAGTAIDRVTIAPAGPSLLARIFALGAASAFRLFRGGADWTPYSGGALDAPVLDLTVLRLPDGDRFVAATATGLYLSVDGGQSYSRKAQAAAGCPIRLITPSLLGATGHPLAAIRQCDGREFLSFDQGATWADRAGPSALLRAAAIRYDDPTFALGATAAGVLKVNYLAPAGQNQWTVTGFAQPTNTVAIAGGALNLLFAGTAGGGLHRSANGGATWVRYGRVVPGGAELPAYVHEIVVHPANREILYLIASETIAGRRGVYRSQDAGESWSLMNAGLENVDVRSLAVDLSGRYGYAGTENGVFAFSESAAINSAPAIVGGGALMRQQGSAGAAASIAMVMDAEQAKGLLRVEATTVPAGIAITDVGNVDGAITATIAAGCNAAVGANTIVFTVHDGEFSAAANLTVNVTANAPPTLGAYAATTVTAGSGVTVAPGAPPADNGGIPTMTTSAPGFSGMLSVDPVTGVVAIGNAGPAGSVTVTVTATDNCGATTTRSFPLTVNPVLPPTCATLPANLVSWYRAEGNAADATGRNPGALQDGVSFASGRVGQAFNFDGVDDAVRVPASTSLNLGAGDGFTLLAWINPADVSTRRPLLEWNTGAAASTQLWLGVTCAFAGCETTPGALHATLPVSGGSPGIVQTGAILAVGEFQLVALSYDKASGQASLYRNGIVAATRNVGSASPLTAGDLHLGARPGSALRFQGLMDEVDLYARALTEAEILAIYNAGISGKCTGSVNASPTITAGAALARQQGSPAVTATIATVNDAETPAGSLIVAATTVPAGITITNLSNANGAITAAVAAGCSAAAGANVVVMTVTDAVGLTATANLTINVAANTPPTLGAYQGGAMTAGGTMMVSPAAPPADNGPLAGISVQANGFGGTLRADVATGTVTIGRAGPAGSYTVVVTATDSCGASIVRSFPLTVNCPVIVINPADPPEGALGVPYSLSFSQAGGFGNPTYAASGILPPGLSFSGDTLSGTPTQLGTFSFNIRVTDAVGCGGSRDYRLFVGNPRPTIASINPAFVVAGAPAFTLTVAGANFVSGATIHWNGAPRTTTFVSATQLTAQIPASDVAMTGAANVTVVNPAPGGGASGSISFTMQPASFRFDGDAWPRPGGDGIVNASDWRQIARYASKLDAPPTGAEFQRADCAPRAARGDQRIALTDIVQAQRYAAGFDPLVEAGGPVAPASIAEGGPLAPAAQPGPRVTLAPATLQRGAIGAVNVQIEGTGAESAVAFTLNFNPAQLVFVDARLSAAAPASAELFVNEQQALNGKLGLLLVLPAGQSLPAGPIAPIALRFFSAGGSAAASATVTFTDDVLPREAADPAAAAVQPLGSVNATVSLAGSAVAFLSAASFAGGPILAPDSIVAAFGANLAAATEAAAVLPLPTSLAGTTVTVTDSAGAQLPAPLFFVSPNQINYLLPAAAAEGVATVTIRNRDGVVSTGLVRVAPVSPGLFSANANGTGVAAAYVLRVAANGSQRTEEIIRFDSATSRFVPVPIDFGPAGDRLFLVLFGTGLRKRSSLQTVAASIAGLALPADFAGPAPGFAGLDQINLELPRSLAGRGEANVLLTVDGAAANIVQVLFR
ncbi:MAG: LamG-like jellyroll fold domain-containing protein [Blastocatellia bacterium]|nr:LamG-like jellyroll fold domain-containing protein [Blastocatellia bacterium]